MFRYFAAPASEMTGLLQGVRQCDLCGEDSALCFDLRRAGVFTREGADGSRSQVGCVACLRAGRFGFIHDTEAGLLLEDGFLPNEEEVVPTRIFVASDSGVIVSPAEAGTETASELLREGSTEELRRTPGFLSWNDVPWLIHCRDFMAYLGTWNPSDFAKAASDGEGHALFCSAVSSEEARLFWPEPNQPPHPDAVALRTFRCQHCGALRVWCDST